MEKQELKELSVSLWDRLRQAIEEGDKNKAASLLDKAQENTQKMRQVVLDVLDTALVELADRCGEGAINDVMRKFCLSNIRPLFGKDWLDIGIDERMRRRARGFADLHNINFDVEEDDEKFVLSYACDTGGYLAEKDKSGKIKSEYPWSQGRVGVTYYCTHCPISFEVMAIEDYGYPWWVTVPPTRPGERCTQYHYKNPKAVPAEHYQHVGMPEKAAKTE